MTTITLDPSVATELATLKEESTGVVERLKGLPDNPALLDQCLSFVQGKLTALEGRRLAITKPLHEAKSQLDAHFRELREPFEEAKGYLKDRLRSLEKARLAANTQALATVVTYDTEGDPVFAAPVLQGKPEGPSYQYHWDWRLDDLSLVPLEFLALNAATMKLYTNRFKDSQTIPEIPGVTFERVPTVRAKPSKG